MVNGGASTPTDSLRCSGDSNESSSFTETRDGNEVPSIAGYGASAGMHYHSTSLQARDDDQAVIQHSRAAQPAAAPDVTPQKALEPNDMMVKMSSVMGAMSPDSPPSHPDGPEHKKPRIAAQDAQTLGQQDQPQPEESAARTRIAGQVKPIRTTVEQQPYFCYKLPIQVIKVRDCFQFGVPAPPQGNQKGEFSLTTGEMDVVVVMGGQIKPSPMCPT